MTKTPRATTKAQPQDDLDALLSPDTPAPAALPVVPRPPPPVADSWVPDDDALRTLLLGWFAPLNKAPGRGPQPEMIIPFTVLLVAAVVARGAPNRTIHVDRIAGAFPPGVATPALTALHGRGWVRYTPIDGQVCILRTPVEL